MEEIVNILIKHSSPVRVNGRYVRFGEITSTDIMVMELPVTQIVFKGTKAELCEILPSILEDHFQSLSFLEYA